MPKSVKISLDDNIKYNKEIKNFLNPDYIYIPYYRDYELLIKNHEKLTLNDVLLQKNNNIYYSTVSGSVVGLTEMLVDNKMMKTIVIENDFKERGKLIGSKKYINRYSKEELIDLVKRLNAYDGSLDGETLIVSGIDLEPYEVTLSYLISEHTDEILECIDALIDILDIHKCFFVINNSDADNVVSLYNQIGTYPHIDLKLVQDLYPNGSAEVLTKDLVTKEKIEKGVIFLTVDKIYNIYNILKKNKPINEKLVTFSGNMLKKSKVINCKIGTNIADIIEQEFKLKEENYHIVINGLLSGYEIHNINAIITPNVRSVFLTSIDKSKPSKCINCGLCSNHCPVGANPRTGYNMDKCIKCGLCSYLCPAKINLLGGKNE